MLDYEIGAVVQEPFRAGLHALGVFVCVSECVKALVLLPTRRELY